MKNSNDLSHEQKVFLVGINRIKEIDSIVENEDRPMTEDEQYEYSEIERILFEHVSKFAIKEANSMLSNYQVSNDAYADVYQELALIFYKNLRNYDPTVSAPTTFFSHYFKEAVRNYILENVIHLTQYHATNIRKVKKALREYAKKNIEPTTEQLVSFTGLSTKVVKKTLQIAYNAKYANIDDEIDMKSTLLTPEESLLSNEESNILGRALLKLDEDEVDLLLRRVNLDGPKSKSYEKVAKETGMTIRSVKTKLSHTIRKLNNDEDLINKFGDRSQAQKERVLSKKITYQSDDLSDLENDLINFFDTKDIKSKDD